MQFTKTNGKINIPVELSGKSREACTYLHRGNSRALLRVADLHHFNSDPDPTFHLNANSGPAFHLNTDQDPDPAFPSNADAYPDPASKINADSDPQPWSIPPTSILLKHRKRQ